MTINPFEINKHNIKTLGLIGNEENTYGVMCKMVKGPPNLNYISYNFNLHTTRTTESIVFLPKHIIKHIIILMLLQWFDLTFGLELPLNNHLVHLVKVGVLDSLPICHNL
jgi:hypothetical protein